MFPSSGGPHIFGVAPGIDFPQDVVCGLRDRLQGQPPHTIANIDVIVNTRRMARRLRDIFDAGPPGLLPRILTLADLDTLVSGIRLPTPISPLRRRLELVQLVSRLLDADRSIAPRSSLYALSDSLAGLIDEMQGEGVSGADIANLDVTDQSGHWERSKKFLGIAQTYLDQLGGAPDAEARQRQLVSQIAKHWAEAPPTHPIIVAGSTGSRGTTALLMRAVAALPQGALIFPGFDFDSPAHVWQKLGGSPPQEDHPQYRFHALLTDLGLDQASVRPWTSHVPPSVARNKLMSLSLRPAPVTDTWLSEGPKLTGIETATGGLTLLEAPTPRIEALAIALRLRKAVDEGKTAALITPDRMLTRQVTAALDRWNILPDDSAGIPLQLSPPGRFLRHVASLFARKLNAEILLTLLKHPLTHSGDARNQHQLFTQRLEQRIRRDGLPYPDPNSLSKVARSAADRMDDPETFMSWVDWVANAFCDKFDADQRPLAVWTSELLDCAEKIAAGVSGGEDSQLWKKQAGQAAESVLADLTSQADHGGEMSAADFADLVGALLATHEVRDRDAPHPGIMIWGTLEARVQGADLVILGGLNDGSWPEAPPPDPWLNRQMRLEAGLLLPERRIGLSAHDYQQAVAAKDVWLSRSIRSDDAETVPSRWLNRLENLLNGLPGGAGAVARRDMATRGQYWVDQAFALEAVEEEPPAPRPSPRPPVSARPRTLSITEIKHLIRDPYAIYAKHVLRLRPLDALVQAPDAPMRGIVLHQIMEVFIKGVLRGERSLTKDDLLRITDEVLAQSVPWPAARVIWRARVARIADWFVSGEIRRQQEAQPLLFEKSARGVHRFEDLGFELFGFADRIDRCADGRAIIYDYKTGAPPTRREQLFFDKQLLIEAAVIEEGGFSEVGPTSVARATFLGLGAKPAEVSAPLDEEPPQAVFAGLHRLLETYFSLSQGFTARRMVKQESDIGPYDQLARFGEWDGTDAPVAEDVK